MKNWIWLSALLLLYPSRALPQLSVAQQRRPLTISITDVGILGGYLISGAVINDRGAVAETSYSDTTGENTAFYWSSRTGFIEIARGTYTQSYDMNDRGQVIGQFITPSDDIHGFVWDVRTRSLQDLGQLVPIAINNDGTIAGWCDEGPCVYDDGHLRPISFDAIGYPGAAYITDLNDHGVVVGSFVSLDSGRWRGFVWSERSRVTVLNPPEGVLESYAAAINDAGLVFGGVSDDSEFGLVYPAFWQRRGTLLAVSSTPINGIPPVLNKKMWTLRNDALWIGEYGPISLPGLPGAERDVNPEHLNDRGQIVGSAVAANGERHLVIWTVR